MPGLVWSTCGILRKTTQLLGKAGSPAVPSAVVRVLAALRYESKLTILMSSYSRTGLLKRIFFPPQIILLCQKKKRDIRAKTLWRLTVTQNFHAPDCMVTRVRWPKTYSSTGRLQTHERPKAPCLLGVHWLDASLMKGAFNRLSFSVRT